MSWFKGARFAASLITFPGVSGVAAHFVDGSYGTFMRFTDEFFIVRVVEGLNEPSIPKLPTKLEAVIQKIIKKPQSKSRYKRSTSSSSSSNGGPQVFKDKKYWCRLFDYQVKDRKITDVKLQYDPSCILYDIFGLKNGSNGGQNSSSNKSQVWDISKINSSAGNLSTSKIIDDNNFVKGGYYLLKMDKNRIFGVNSTLNIELSAPGTGLKTDEQTYLTKLATLKIEAVLNGNTEEKVPFKFKTTPSSLLVLKKVNSITSSAHQSSLEQVSSSSSKSNGKEKGVSWILKKNGVSNGESEIPISGMWSFPSSSVLTSDKSFLENIDLQFLDRVLFTKLKDNSSPIWTFIFNLFLLPTSEYYLVKTTNSFWDYSIGDELKLVRRSASSTSSSSSQVSGSSFNLVSAHEKKGETEISSFKIVSGLLGYSPIPLNCIPENGLGFWDNNRYKKNYASTGTKKVFIANDLNGKKSIPGIEIRKDCRNNNPKLPNSSVIILRN